MRLHRHEVLVAVVAPPPPLLAAQVDAHLWGDMGRCGETWGEIVCAFVILKDGCKVSEKDLINWSKSKLARYKCPKRVIFINDEEMPRNTTGKILHKQLKKMIKELN